MFAGSTAGPCPNCGGSGVIPDGVYGFERLAADALASATTDEKQALLRRLTEIRDAPVDVSGEDLAKALEDAGARWKPIAEFVRIRNLADVATYLGLLIAIIAIFL